LSFALVTRCVALATLLWGQDVALKAGSLCSLLLVAGVSCRLRLALSQQVECLTWFLQSVLLMWPKTLKSVDW